MATTDLTFHPRCGNNAQVKEGGMIVERVPQRLCLPNYKLGHGGALTARPLRTEEIITLQLGARPELEFGVTTHSPEEVDFPVYMSDLQESWCVHCANWGWVYVNGEEYNKKFLSRAALDSLEEGDILGLQVTKNRKLIYYMNGKEVGVAATDIPDVVYGFVDLWSPSFPAVKLIFDVQEVHTATRALPQTTQTQRKDEKIEEKKHSELKPQSTVREIAYSELEFGETVGKGGQGAVYKGHWKTTSFWKTGSHSVAIKRVLGMIRDEEAEILSKLSHPNVITFYGICRERYPEYFIITELAEGGSLYNLIHEQHYHPDLEESIRWAEEIAEGMRYLHQQKVAHRDLKSHNGMLCDFGSAKTFDHTTLQTGTGTYRWIAPEVLNGVKVSLSCDVFSYGMVLFEIFKQEVPFAGIHDIKVANMILEGKTPAIPISLKPFLANLMKCCWQMNPKARPHFEEILVILEKKECPEPVGESPADTWHTTDGGPADVLLTPKDLPHLETVLEEATIVWYPLGMKLKLDTKTLSAIAIASGNDTSTALNIVLTRWLKSKVQPPHLQSLTAALCSPEIGLTHLSDALLKDKDQFGQ